MGAGPGGDPVQGVTGEGEAEGPAIGRVEVIPAVALVVALVQVAAGNIQVLKGMGHAGGKPTVDGCRQREKKLTDTGCGRSIVD